MRTSLFLAAATILASSVHAQFVSENQRSSTTKRVTVAPTVTTAPSAVTSPCKSINRIVSSWSAKYPAATEGPYFAPSLATKCLESVPLNVARSNAFIEYIRPYLQFQSTVTYLKDPPQGYTLPGVDIFGGLDLIQKNVQNGVYKNQWSFEKDLFSLINILPHDFHFNLPLPLVSTFVFATYQSIVSLSDDGLTLPSVYFKDDLDELVIQRTDFEPSNIVKINGEATATYLERLALTMSSFQDPDAIYNQLLFSLPQDLQGGADLFNRGAWRFGFASDTNIYEFKNGSKAEFYNYASVSPSVDFSLIDDGPSLFQALEVNPTTDVTQLLSKRDVPEEPMKKVRRQSSSSTMVGYPEPWIVHPEDPYTAGFFLGTNSGIAVLTISAFAGNNATSDTDQDNMQIVIAEFLEECKRRGSTKLIIDLSANGGGSVFSGYDAFKQLFPSVIPYGGSRMRTTPFVDYIGNVYSSAGVYNRTIRPPWQTQSALDKDLKKYPSWVEMGGPFRFHGDNFLGTTRANLSDPLMTSGFSVYGYLDKTTIPAAAFDAKNIILLYDGSCGSTCAIFSEFMKIQGGVRSIAYGGRPQTGPMQGVGGSKGAQVLTYLNIEIHREALNSSLAILKQKGKSPPAAPAAAFIPPNLFADTPLGSKVRLMRGARINLRNAIRESDTTQTPLQFVYEATNCRLFYTVEDVYDMTFFWNRAANVTWGGQKCVEGSTITTDQSLPGLATDTVAYTTKANTNIQLPAQPGLVPIGSTPGTGQDSGVATFKTGAKNSGVKAGVSGTMSILCVMTVMFLYI